MAPEDSLPNRFGSLSSLSYSSLLSDFDFLPYKTWKTPGLVSCFSSGIIKITAPDGSLFTEFDSGHVPLFCASVYSTEEILIASLDSSYLRVFTISFNSTGNYPVTMIADLLLFENTSTRPTAFTQYSRLNRKMWVVGDSDGFITVVSIDGEVQGKAYGKVGEILFIEKYAQQIVYAGKHKVAVLNTGNLEVGTMCESTISEIISIALDISPAVIFVALKNGDITVYDSRFSINNGPSYCKAVYRLYAKTPGKLGNIKGNLFSMNSEFLTVFNTSFLDYDSVNPPQYYKLSVTNLKKIKSFKNNNVNLLAISTDDQIKTYEIKTLENVPKENTGFGIDMGYVRMIAIAFAVICVILWKSKGRKSKRELEVERLEESLAELQRSMESTSKISEDLTSRFKNVEASTKHLTGLRNAGNDSDSD